MMMEASILGPAKDEESTQLVPDWPKADLVAMKDAIANIDWMLEFGERSGKECMDLIYKVLDRETESMSL